MKTIATPSTVSQPSFMRLAGVAASMPILTRHTSHGRHRHRHEPSGTFHAPSGIRRLWMQRDW